MTKTLGLLTLHGIGRQEPDFAQSWLDLLQEELEEKNSNAWAQVYHESIFYQGLLQPNQDRVMRSMAQQADLDWGFLREFLIYGLSDAAIIEHMAHERSSLYEQSQLLILDALERMFAALGSVEGPVIILAHSLGGHVLSNYLWDADPNRRAAIGIWRDVLPLNTAEDRFLRLRSTRYLFTFGCNIPLFVSGMDDIIPIDRPNDDFRWLNYYDRDDALGWPLSPLSRAYDGLVTDREVSVGGLLTGWNPASHSEYWRSDEMVADITEAIIALTGQEYAT